MAEEIKKPVKKEEPKEKQPKKESLETKKPVETKEDKKAEIKETKKPQKTTEPIKSKEKKEPEKPEKTKGTKGIVHIYSSGNNTIINITDITGSETISRISGGMVTKADRLKGAPFQGMLAGQKVAEEAIKKGVDTVDIRIRAPGGHKQMNIGKGVQPAIKAISRSGLKINIIEDVTPIIHGYVRRKGGRKGRRL